MWSRSSCIKSTPALLLRFNFRIVTRTSLCSSPIPNQGGLLLVFPDKGSPFAFCKWDGFAIATDIHYLELLYHHDLSNNDIPRNTRYPIQPREKILVDTFQALRYLSCIVSSSWGCESDYARLSRSSCVDVRSEITKRTEWWNRNIFWNKTWISSAFVV